jgi:hypothetical protein
MAAEGVAKCAAGSTFGCNFPTSAGSLCDDSSFLDAGAESRRQRPGRVSIFSRQASRSNRLQDFVVAEQ